MLVHGLKSEDSMVVGYARVSTKDQNLERQLDKLTEYGCDKIFSEKITGVKKERPELMKMLEYVRSGDVIVVSELTRLGRSSKELLNLMELFQQKGVDIKSLGESWLDTTTAQGKFIYTIFAGFAQFERDLNSIRTKDGLEAARARGRFGGRPPMNKDKIEMALKMYESKDFTLEEIRRATGMSKTTIYRYINDGKEKS